MAGCNGESSTQNYTYFTQTVSKITAYIYILKIIEQWGPFPYTKSHIALLALKTMSKTLGNKQRPLLAHSQIHFCKTFQQCQHVFLPRAKFSKKKKPGWGGGSSLTRVENSSSLPQIIRYCLLTKLYDVTSQTKTIVIFSAVKIPNCTISVNILCMKPKKLWTIQIINDYTECANDTFTNVIKYSFLIVT